MTDNGNNNKTNHNTMKKTINIILIFAMLSAMALPTAGCKKTQTEPKTVNVTFTALGDAKTTISPRGVVEFIPGDQIHVFDANYGYLGYLDYQHAGSEKGGPATFYGALKQWNDNTTLRFIYMGNHTPTYNKALDITLMDQTYDGEQSSERDLENIAENFLVSSYEEQSVSADKLEYSGHLTSVMSILALNTSEFNDGTNVKILRDNDTELRNRISISAKGEISYGYYGRGEIITGPGQSLRYIAVLPSQNEDIPYNLYLTSNAKDGTQHINSIAVNTLITDYINTTIPATAVSDANYVDMALASDQVFTVNTSGKKVKFAKSNLVYDHGRFKMHKTPFTVLEHGAPSDRSTFDHFAWGTSGWRNGSVNFMPYNYGHDLEGNYWGPQNGSNYYDLTGAYAKSDWGVYQFGMNTGTEWRTLTKDEMNYVLNNNNRGAYRYLCVNITIDDVTHGGLIIFPDNFDAATLTGSYTYNSNTIYDATNDWSTMEASGAVFLPRAGYGWKNRMTDKFDYSAGDGCYWSSTCPSKSDAYYLSISRWGGCSTGGSRPKSWMYSVRLVSDVN